MRLRIDIYNNMASERCRKLMRWAPFVAEVDTKDKVHHEGVWVRDVNAEEGTVVLRDIHTGQDSIYKIHDIIQITIY